MVGAVVPDHLGLAHEPGGDRHHPRRRQNHGHLEKQ